jgi:hypothetical protein
MTHELIIKALKNLAPNAEWTLSGDDYADLIWLSEGKPPTLKAIETEIEKIPGKTATALKEVQDAKAALLTKLGITAEEAVLLLS